MTKELRLDKELVGTSRKFLFE